jgi:hypothetical protein
MAKKYTRSIPPIPVAPKPAPVPQGERIDWATYPWGRLGWSPSARDYSVEMLSGKTERGFKNRGEALLWAGGNMK